MNRSAFVLLALLRASSVFGPAGCRGGGGDAFYLSKLKNKSSSTS